MTTHAHRTDGKPRRLARLVAYVEMMAAEETKSGHAELGRDLRALLALLRTAEKEIPTACNIPEWDNHLDDNGNPVGLGDVAGCYGLWVEYEAVEPACEHDGACQLAALTSALRMTLNRLDRLADAN